MSKQFYLPMRDANDPHKVTLIPVSEEVYTNITPETNRIRSRRQYHGQCCCPKQYLWKCDGDCDVCEYRAAGDNLSLDYETEMHGDTFADTSDTEEIVTDQILMCQLLERLKELMPEAITVGQMSLDEDTNWRSRTRTTSTQKTSGLGLRRTPTALRRRTPPQTARPSRASRRLSTKPNGSMTTPFSMRITKPPAKENGNG